MIISRVAFDIEAILKGVSNTERLALIADQLAQIETNISTYLGSSEATPKDHIRLKGVVMNLKIAIESIETVAEVFKQTQ